MIAIQQLNNDGVINANTIVQNNIENNVQAAQESTTGNSDCNPAATPAEPLIRLNTKKGNRINLYRVIVAMHEYGFFKSPNGGPADQKEVFAAFSAMLGDPFNGYDNNLSEGKKHNNDSDAAEKIFDDLKRLFLETHD